MNIIKNNHRVIALLLVLTTVFMAVPLGSFTAVAAPAPAEPTSLIAAGAALKAISTVGMAILYISKGITAAVDTGKVIAGPNASLVDIAGTAIYSFAGKTYDPNGEKTPLYYNDYMNSVKQLKTELLLEFETVNSNIAAVCDKIEAVANEEYINNFLLVYNGGYVNLASDMMAQYKNLSAGFDQGFSTADEIQTAYNLLYTAADKLEKHLSYFLITGVLSDGKMTTIQDLLYNSFGEGSYEYVRSLYETYVLAQYFLQLCSVYQLNYCAQTGRSSYTVSPTDSFFATNIPARILDTHSHLETITAKLAKLYTGTPSKLNVNVGGTNNYTVIPVSNSIEVAKNDVIHLPAFHAAAGETFSHGKLYYEISNPSLATASADGLITVKASSGSFSVTVRYDSSLPTSANACYTLNFTVKPSAFSGGLGTETHPYLITTASDFKNIFSSTTYSSKHFFLGADIDLDGATVSSLSTFTGVIDGNGHRVYDFNAVNLIDNNQGTVKNLTLGHPTASTTVSKTYNEPQAETTYIIGVLVATNNGTLQNCVMENVSVSISGKECDNNKDYETVLGGLVGFNNGTVSECVVKGSTISASMKAEAKSGDNIIVMVGGIVGMNVEGTVESSVSRSNTISARSYVWGTGGLFPNKSVPSAAVGGIAAGNTYIIQNCAVYGGSSSATATGKENYKDASAQSACIAAADIGYIQNCYGSKTFAPVLSYSMLSDPAASAIFESDGDMSRRISVNGPLYKDASGLPMPNFVTETELRAAQSNYGILNQSGFNTAGISLVLKMKSGAGVETTHFRLSPTVNSIIGEKNVTVYCGSDRYAKHTVIIPCPHSNTYIRTEKVATCNEDGYTEGVFCNDCETWISGNVTRPRLQDHSYGDYSSTSDTEHKRVCLICGNVEQTAHKWNEGETVVYPTHTSTGTVKYTCTLCSRTKTESLPTVGDHSFGAWKNYSDTKHYRECACGKEEYASHTWNAGEITVQPTHMKEGTKLYTCTGCGATKTESVPTTAAHAFGDWKNYSDVKHSRECPCGETEYADHTWNAGEITTQPTHLKEGTKKYTCTGCGATRTETLPTTAAHAFGDWKNYSDAKHSRECPCGETEYADHTWNAGEITVQPSHLKEGTKKYTCSGCNATKTETLPKSDAHEFAPWKSYSELLHSRDCGCGFAEYGEHAWGDGIPKKLPTHLSEGETMYICSVCNATKSETVDKLPDHTYVYSVITPATATQSGMGKYACACGDSYTAVIPMRAITLTSDKVISKNGNTVSITVNVSQNCGFSYLRFTLDYDKSALTLVSVQNGEIIADMDSGVNLLWSASADSTSIGTLVTLTFEVSPYAEAGDYTVDFISRECFNAKGEEVGVSFRGSSITLLDYLDGDANGDGAVNGKDVMILRKHFATLNDETGTSGVKLYYGADANGDGTVDGRDLILLRQYMAYYNDETGRSEIILGANG